MREIEREYIDVTIFGRPLRLHFLSKNHRRLRYLSDFDSDENVRLDYESGRWRACKDNGDGSETLGLYTAITPQEAIDRFADAVLKYSPAFEQQIRKECAAPTEQPHA